MAKNNSKFRSVMMVEGNQSGDIRVTLHGAHGHDGISSGIGLMVSSLLQKAVEDGGNIYAQDLDDEAIN